MSVLLLAVLGAFLILCSLVGALTFLYWFYPKPLVMPMTRYMAYWKAGLKRRFLHIGGFTFCYYERSPGAVKNTDTLAILFIHGYASGKSMWISTAQFLPREWHVVALDLPGHGESSFKPEAGYTPMGLAEKVSMFVEALGLDKFHIVGHSLGASVAGCYTAFNPDQVLSITLSAMPGLHHLPGGKATELMERADKEKFNSPYMLPTSPEEFAAVMKSALVAAESFMPHYRLMKALVDLNRPNYPAFKEIMRDMYNCDIGTEIQKVVIQITTSTLIVWGNQDEFCHPSGAELLGSMIEGSKVVKLDQCGHMIAMEQPSKLSAVISEFITEKKTL